MYQEISLRSSTTRISHSSRLISRNHPVVTALLVFLLFLLYCTAMNASARFGLFIGSAVLSVCMFVATPRFLCTLHRMIFLQ